MAVGTQITASLIVPDICQVLCHLLEMLTGFLPRWHLQATLGERQIINT